MERFGTELVFKAHIFLHGPTIGSRVKKMKKMRTCVLRRASAPRSTPSSRSNLVRPKVDFNYAFSEVAGS